MKTKKTTKWRCYFNGLQALTTVLLLGAMFYATPSSAQWHYMGLKSHVVHRLKIHGDTLYAATDNGIFKRSWHNSDTLWVASGLQGKRVVDLAIACRERIFAYTHDTITGRFMLYFTPNGGASYQLFRTDPGTVNFYYDNTSSYIAIAPGQTDTVLLLPHWQYTHDGGDHWHDIEFDPASVGNMVRFIKVNPERSSEVWIGGENMIFSPILLHSCDGGKIFTQLPTQGFFPGDNCLHDIVADGLEWFVAGEGIVSQTSTKGVTWHEKMNLWDTNYGLYLNTIAFSPDNRNSIYVTGGGSNTFDKVVFMASHNRGLTWDTLTWTPFQGISYFMITMAVGRKGHDKVFLGGYNGVYLYDMLPTPIREIPEKTSFSLFPNPAGDQINITFGGQETSASLSARLYSLSGQEMFRYDIPESVSNTISLPLNQSPGMYILALYADGLPLAREKLIIQ